MVDSLESLKPKWIDERGVASDAGSEEGVPFVCARDDKDGLRPDYATIAWLGADIISDAVSRETFPRLTHR